ncbi:hypothetical protein C0T31_11835 [Dysgonamonadaceae bacterium]|nr:hypothetical protein C0T31_11835 [Dysgonamonadaceae bacterium]
MQSIRSMVVNNNQKLDGFLEKQTVFPQEIEFVKLIRFKFLSRERKSAIVWHLSRPEICLQF